MTFACLLALLVPVLSVVNDAADRRLFLGCHFDEIEVPPLRNFEGLLGGDDPQLFTFCPDDTYRCYADLVIYSRVGSVDRGNPFMFVKSPPACYGNWPNIDTGLIHPTGSSRETVASFAQIAFCGRLSQLIQHLKKNGSMDGIGTISHAVLHNIKS